MGRKFDRTDDFKLAQTAHYAMLLSATIVQQVTEIEDNLRKVCPPAIYRHDGQPPVFTPEQIRGYEERFNHLSVWEKINFYRGCVRP